MSTNRQGLLTDMKKCSCKGNNLDKLIQPTLLTMLAKVEEGMHGYRIMEELGNKNLFSQKTPDSTGVYRTLRTLEERNLVISKWDVSGTGPAKKIYSITNVGRECLEQWIYTLQQYKETIDIILKDAKNVCNKK